MNYLLYIERAAENLQFYLWFRGYLKRFQDLPANEKSLSPPWGPERGDPPALGQRGPRPRQAPPGTAAEIFKGTDFDPSAYSEKGPVTEVNPFEDDWSSAKLRDDETATLQSSIRTDVKKSVAQAFEAADVKLQPCKCPLRTKLGTANTIEQSLSSPTVKRSRASSLLTSLPTPLAS